MDIDQTCSKQILRKIGKCTCNLCISVKKLNTQNKYRTNREIQGRVKKIIEFSIKGWVGGQVRRGSKSIFKKIKKTPLKSNLGHFQPLQTNFFPLVGGVRPGTTTTHHLLPLTPITSMVGGTNSGCQWLVVVGVRERQFMAPVGGSCGQPRHYHNPPLSTHPPVDTYWYLQQSVMYGLF